MTILTNPTYNPAALLDFAIEKLNLKNDADLSRALNMMPPVVSKVRNKRMPLGPSMLLRLHEEIGMGTLDLKKIAGMS